MSVLSSRALHEQLSVIMGALTKAAVAEICEVVDEGYAVLQMEISRSHKENEDLRKKLHLIESIVVRGSGGGKPAAAATEPGAVEIEPQTKPPPPPPQQQRDSDGGEAATAGGGDGAETVVVPEEFPDVVLIKDEDSDSNDVYEEGDKTPADRGSGASTPISRRTKRPWSGNEDALCQSLKSSPSEPLSMKSPTSRLGAGTPKKTMSSVYTLDSPHSEPVCSELEAAESACSYSSQMDPDLHVIHQDCSLLSSRPPPYFSTGALMESQSPSGRAELDLSLTWTKQAKTQTSFAHFHQNDNVDSDAFGLKLVSVSGSTSADCQLSESSNSAFDYDDADMVNFGLYRDQSGQLSNGRPGSVSKVRRFMCSICKKTYATSQNLDVHMRIHTGERPFSCDQCGKKFTQSAHLKSHLSVHTGERPYACTICSRSFIVQYSLKLHMKKCHPNV